MANSDKNIIITPNKNSSTSSPTIEFTGFSSTPVQLTISDDSLPSLTFKPKELVNNGNFSNSTTGWTAGTGGTLSVTSGVLRITNTSNNGRAISNTFNCIAGKKYTIRAKGVARTGSSFYLEIRNLSGASIVFQNTTAGTYSYTFTATAVTHYLELYAIGGAGTYVEWDDISIKQNEGLDLLTIDSNITTTDLYSIVDGLGFPIVSIDTNNNIEIGAKTGITSVSGKGLVLPGVAVTNLQRADAGLISFDFTNKTIKVGDGKTWIDVREKQEVRNLQEYARTGQLVCKWDTMEKLTSVGGISTEPRSIDVTGEAYGGNCLFYKASGASGVWTEIADKANTGNPGVTGVTLVWWARESTSPNTYQRWFDWYPTSCNWMDKQNSTTYNFGAQTVNFANICMDTTFTFQSWRMYAITMNTGRQAVAVSQTVYFSHNGEIFFANGTSHNQPGGCGTVSGFMGYNGAADAYSYYGWMGQCRYYKRVLTRGEIISLYNDGRGRFDWW